MKLQEKIDSLPEIIQKKFSGLIDILVHNYQIEKEINEEYVLAMQLTEFILSTKDINLLKKVEALIEQELDSQLTPWEKQELEKTMKNFNIDDCIANEEVMARIKNKYGY